MVQFWFLAFTRWSSTAPATQVPFSGRRWAWSTSDWLIDWFVYTWTGTEMLNYHTTAGNWTASHVTVMGIVCCSLDLLASTGLFGLVWIFIQTGKPMQAVRLHSGVVIVNFSTAVPVRHYHKVTAPAVSMEPHELLPHSLVRYSFMLAFKWQWVDDSCSVLSPISYCDHHSKGHNSSTR